MASLRQSHSFNKKIANKTKTKSYTNGRGGTQTTAKQCSCYLDLHRVKVEVKSTQSKCQGRNNGSDITATRQADP